MDVERGDDTHWHFRLGPVEKWVVAAIAAGFVGMVGVLASRFDKRLEQLDGSVQTVVVQQAVSNQQMATLNLQLADVPALTRQMAEVKVRLDRHDEDLRELRGTRGLK